MQSIIDFLLLMLKLAVPLVFAAEGAMIAERSGVICLGVEGLMLFGSFFGAWGSYLTGSAWLGIGLAVCAGLLVSLLYGVFAIYLKGQQIVVGVAINMLAAGITPMLCSIVWGNEGFGATVPFVRNITLPGSVGSLTPFAPLTLLMVAAMWFFIRKTKYGLRLRMTGDNPLGVQTCGINTNRYKLAAVLACGVLSAIGGAYLSVGNGNVFVANMVAGRGYMGVAANIFGGWTPVGGALAGVFFAAVQTLRYTLVDIQIPTQLMQMLPYVVTLIALLAFGRNSKSVEGLGKL